MTENWTITVPDVRTVQVSNISLAAAKRDINHFFSFSGEIQYVQMLRESETTQLAYVTFKDSQGADTALLLTGATIADLSVTITPAENYKLPPGALPLDKFMDGHTDSRTEVRVNWRTVSEVGRYHGTVVIAVKYNAGSKVLVASDSILNDHSGGPSIFGNKISLIGNFVFGLAGDWMLAMHIERGLRRLYVQTMTLEEAAVLMLSFCNEHLKSLDPIEHENDFTDAIWSEYILCGFPNKTLADENVPKIYHVYYHYTGRFVLREKDSVVLPCRVPRYTMEAKPKRGNY